MSFRRASEARQEEFAVGIVGNLESDGGVVYGVTHGEPSAMRIAILIAAVVSLYVWNIRRLLGFERDYKYDGNFAGKRYECTVGGLSEGHGTLCFMGADAGGLYLLPHPKPARSLWSYLLQYRRYEVFRRTLLIPWTDLGYRSGRVLLKDCIWFDLSPRKVYFYVAKDIGEKLLNDAGREMPL